MISRPSRRSVQCRLVFLQRRFNSELQQRCIDNMAEHRGWLKGGGQGRKSPAARQNRSKLADTSSQALPTAPVSVGAEAIDVVLTLFMALLSFRGIGTPSLPAQGEQRRSSYFNIRRGNPPR